MKQPEFGKNVAERRNELGFTQEELAEKCKINVRSIQRIEAGIVNPRKYTIKILIDVLDLESGISYNKKIESLRELYEHLSLYLIINFFTYLKYFLDSTKEFKIHKFSIIWGFFILLQIADIFFDVFLRTVWKETKIQKIINNANVYKTLRNKISSNRLISKFSPQIVTIVLVSISIGWYLFLGYHDHNVTINKGAISVGIESTNSNFEFSLVDKGARMMNEYAINKYEMTSELGKPFNINGHGIILSEQTINLPDSVSEYKFAVNEFDFILKGNNLFQGKNNWYIQPNELLIINADKIN
jgi:transcriptional regulator with XRE-family HTH domain